MHCIMNNEIGGIACNKSCKEYPSCFAHCNPENFIKECRKQDRNDRRHYQAIFIARKFMMHSVDIILKTDFFFSLRIKMEYKTMNKIFNQGKYYHAQRKEPQKRKRAFFVNHRQYDKS